MSHLEDLLIDWGYVLVLVGPLLENAGLPVPGDSALFWTAYLAARGHLRLDLLVLLAAVGAVLGDNLGYWAGRRGGRPLLERLGQRWPAASRALARTEHFFARHWQRAVEPPRLTAEARRALEAYGWPGNVRELDHVVKRACVLATGHDVGLELLPRLLGTSPTLPPPQVFTSYTADELDAAKTAAAGAVEREFLEGLMARCENNVSLASRHSGIHRSYLQRLLARNGIGGPRLPAGREPRR